MEWHIVTGSKGGVGKTLLSLFLLARSFDDESGHTLVVDLNSMNIDFARSLRRNTRNNGGFHKKLTEQHGFDVELLQIELIKEENRITTTSTKEYLLMYPSNPFLGMNADSFTSFLVNLGDSIENGTFLHFDKESSNKRNPPITITRVIIDTNYHFCNIFHQHDVNKNYAPYKKPVNGDESKSQNLPNMKNGVASESNDLSSKGLYKDDFFVWFMWVAAQLEALRQNTDEMVVVFDTAAVIEEILGRWTTTMTHPHNKVSRKRITPFMHLISPVSLITANPNDDCNIIKVRTKIANALTNSVSKLFGKAQVSEEDKDGDFTITALGSCCKAPTRASLKFEELFDEMKNRIPSIPEECTKDAHNLLAQILCKVAGAYRPANIFPLASYHRDLKYYTDDQIAFDFNWLRGLQVYKEFNKMIAETKQR